MEITMSSFRTGVIVCLFGLAAAAAHAQSSTTAAESASAAPPVENGVPIARLVSEVGHKTHKKFVVDPRVRADIALGDLKPSDLSYDDLREVLFINGFILTEHSGYVDVLTNAFARQWIAPVISGKETRPDTEIVTKILSAKNIAVVQLVPILRPMIPQYGHLAALPCVNKLIMVDSYANVRRIESVIEALDVGEPYKPEKCETPRPADKP
jgi:general secretion pathway protein D